MSEQDGVAPASAKSLGSRISLYACGTLGALLAFSVYYMRNADVIGEFAQEHGVAGGLVATLILLLGSGVWSVVTRPRDYQAALLTGLGFPGLVFAMGPTGAEVAEPDVEVSRAGFLPAAADGGLFSDALRLVFSPVGATVQARVKPIAEESRQLRQERDVANDRRDELQREIVTVQQEAQSQQSQVRASEAEALLQVRAVEEQYVAVARSLEEVTGELVQARILNEQLETQVQTVVSAGANYAAELEEQARAVQQLTETVTSYDRVMIDLGRELDAGAVDFLYEVVRDESAPHVRAKAVESLSQIQEARRGDVRDTLDGLSRTAGDQRLRKAADEALRRLGGTR